MTENSSADNFKFQKYIAAVGLILFVCKIVAWRLTHSVAILTDALESTINVISGFLGLYSLYLSALPKDKNHPYGHGKVEFISAAVEGILIAVAGGLILFESIQHLSHPSPISSIDYGIILVSATAIINYVVGAIAIKKGKANNSIALEASGKHLQTDTYSTFAIVLGLLLVRIFDILWLDSLTALIMAIYIIYNGVKIIRESLAGIMDEADDSLLHEVVTLLNASRRPFWIDLHNLRIIKYGGVLHLDCHITVPWYLNVHQAHDEVEALDDLIKANFGASVEMFVHTDGCLPFSCTVCQVENCAVRQNPLTEHIEWTVENISTNQKHGMPV